MQLSLLYHFCDFKAQYYIINSLFKSILRHIGIHRIHWHLFILLL